MTHYRSNDGTGWNVSVQLPSHSSAIVLFADPSGNSHRDRYAILNGRGPQVNDPRGRLDPGAVLAGLTDRELALLYRRSIPVQTDRPAYIAS